MQLPREAAKKVLFFSGPAPPPLELSGHIFGGFFFLSSFKSFFFLVARSLVVGFPLLECDKCLAQMS